MTTAVTQPGTLIQHFIAAATIVRLLEALGVDRVGGAGDEVADDAPVENLDVIGR
jgi:hypothetical protein